MLLNVISYDTLITIGASVALSVVSGVIVFLILYFTNLIKIESRLSRLEEKMQNQQKVLDFVEEKIINEVIAKGNNSNNGD